MAGEKLDPVEAEYKDETHETIKWHRKRWVRILAGVIVASMVAVEAFGSYLPVLGRITGHAAANEAKESERDPYVRELVEKLDDPKDAIEVYKHILSLQSQQSQLVQAQEDAQKYLEAGDYDRALTSVDYLIENADLSSQNYAQMLSVKMALCFYLEDYEQTSQICDELMTKDQDAAAYYHYVKAVCNMQAGAYDVAEQEFSAALENEAYLQNDEIYYYRGTCYLTEEAYEPAYEDFSKAIVNGGEMTELYYNRAVAALGAEKLEEAQKDLQRVLENNDNKELTEAAKELLELF